MRFKKSGIINGFQILKAIYAVRMNRRIPLYCEWEIISHCNMQCSFCSTWVNNRNTKVDISTKEAIDIIEQLSELGTKIIHFSGGEPTLRNDLPELITKAKEKNMIVSITTNGSAPIHKMEKLLCADLIRVSIDGTREFHDSIRNAPGAYEKAINTIKFLKSRNVSPLITTVFTPDTSYDMLGKLANIAQSFKIQLSLNVLGRSLNDNPSDLNARNSSDLNTPLFAKYLSVLQKLRKSYGRVISNSEPIPTIIQQGGLNVFGCRAMDIAISIKPDGAVSLPCTGFYLKLLKGNLKEIYYGDEATKLRVYQGKHPMCKGCYIKCMCSASALLKTKGLVTILDSYIKTLF